MTPTTATDLGADAPERVRSPAPAPAPAAQRTSRAAAAGRTADRGPLDGAREPAIADAVRIVGWLSIAAGVIHAMAMVDHFSHWWAYGVFFLVLTYGQILWGVALLRRRRASDRALLIGARATAAIVGAWLFSRTIGVPLGPEAGSAEPLGAMDVAVTLDQLVLIAYVAAIVRPRLRVMQGFRTLMGVHRIRLAMMLASASVFAALLGGHQH